MLRTFNLLLLILAAFCLCDAVSAAETSRFKISVDSSLAQTNQPLQGRLLIFMTDQVKERETLEPDFWNPKAVWVTGKEVSNWQAGETVEINADDLAFPAKFANAPPGTYQVMALLDANHSYTYGGAGAGDLYSDVVKVTMPSAETALNLSRVVSEKKILIPDSVKLIDFESPRLSAFWGRVVRMTATVFLPPSYDESKRRTYPTVYTVHGYGASYLSPMRDAPALTKLMREGKRPEMIYVALNAQCPLGHHVFADSANNGPWGTALVKELIPYLEKQFRMDAKPRGRFVTGHSSGGWATLWLMIQHPDFFGGAWSTAPDDVDFRLFNRTDLTQYPPQNLYRDRSGRPRNIMRMNGREVMSVEERATQERVLGYFGGQMASYEAVFSPKSEDGQPMPLFDRDTGHIDPFVQKAWEKYDISRYLRDNWKTLAPKLKGKLHIIVGTDDTIQSLIRIFRPRLQPTLVKNIRCERANVRM